jgi:glutamine cyclotransferase
VANADDATVSRVDPDTMRVARTIGIGGPPVDLAVGPDALWAATGSDGTVVRVDPDAEAVVETIDLRGSSDLVWNTTYALAVGSAGLWVAVGPRSLVRVDPATNETECTVDARHVPVSIAIGAGTVWAVTLAGRALRIEPRTNGITAEATIAYPVDLAADDDAIWVADVYGRLWRIDPDTAATVFTTPVAAGPFSICSAGSGLWAADNGDGRVLRIDPENGRVSAAVEIGHAPTDVAVGLDATWVTVQSDRAI